MVGHDAEAFFQGVTMMLCSIAALFEIGKDGMCIHQWQMLALSLTHNANTPIDIGRMAVLQIVRKLTGYLCAHIESLMTHQHTLLE